MKIETEKQDKTAQLGIGAVSSRTFFDDIAPTPLLIIHIVVCSA